MFSSPVCQLSALALSLAVAPATARADLVQSIIAHVGSGPTSYREMVARLSALAANERVSLLRVGRSVRGRDILCVAVHDPRTVFGQGKRLFVVARQHGSEVSGTEAVLALVQHFATAQGELERGTLQRMTIIAIPMLNPDGADSRRRDNANGVDLNRDWADLSQPETRAADYAIRAWRPHALVDLHELPQNTPRPSYAENFIQTIGGGPGIARCVSSHTIPVAADLAMWLKLYGFAANIYYDGPDKDARLCHRRYGLRQGIPSFLVEAKTGVGRPLLRRVAFHTLSLLVIANHLLHSEDATAGPVLAQTPPAVAAQDAGPRPTGPAGPPTVDVRCSPRAPSGPLHLEAIVRGAAEVRYVKFILDGRLRAITNSAPFQCLLDADDVGNGPHELTVEVIGPEGAAVARTHCTLNPDGALVAG